MCRDWEATSVTSGIGVFTLILLLSLLAIYRGKVNNVTYTIPIHTNNMWRKLKTMAFILHPSVLSVYMGNEKMELTSSSGSEESSSR